MNAGASGLYSFKRKRLATNHELQPPLFSDFRVWVLERWKFAPEDQCFGDSPISGQVDYVNNGFISEDDLEDFLFRKRNTKFDLCMQPTGPRFKGRLRIMFSVKKNDAAPSLAMRQSDFNIVERELKLHPSTSQYVRRTMKASRFWGLNKSTFSLLLSFPPFPAPKFSSISLSYDTELRFTNGLVTEVDDIHRGPQVEDFKRMLDTCPELWPHPLLVPILLLDMLMDNLEAEILVNIQSIEKIEAEVSQLPSLDMNTRPLAERTNVTGLLTRLHNTLKTAIKLLDAASWIDKAAMMLNEIGDELDKTHNVGTDSIWVEMQAFLEDLGRITDHLKPDPIMTQQRCISQIDILNNKIAQEDNLLAARMAVSATRDSSAMKALAVITATFLPGTYIATLFSMSMFNWQGGGNSSTFVASNTTASSDISSSSAVVMPYIWIYWVISAVLTVVVIAGWRVWWVMQDRDFRRDLPSSVQSEGLSLTPKYGENPLPRSFFEDVIGFSWPKRKKT